MPEAGSNQQMFPFNKPAGRDIRPSRVVKISPIAAFCAEEAVAADMPFGIAQEWTQHAPGTPYDTGFVADDAQPGFMVYGPGQVARAALKDNAPALTPGMSVGANADSELVQVTTGWAVGWLMEPGTALKDQKLRIFVFPHHRGGGSD